MLAVGSNALNVLSNGNVGIGTASPIAKVVISAGAAGLNGNATLAQLRVGDGNPAVPKLLSLGFDTFNNVGVIQAGIDGAGQSSLLLNPQGGNIGIGNSSPSYKLDVSGIGHFTSLVDADHFVATSSSNTSLFSGGFLSLASSTIGNGTQAGGLTISGGATTTGNLYVNGTSFFNNNVVVANGCCNGYSVSAGAFILYATSNNGKLSLVTNNSSNSNFTVTFAPANYTVAGLSVGQNWTALQQFTNASTTLFSSYGPAYFGSSATSSFSTSGALTMAGPVSWSSGLGAITHLLGPTDQTFAIAAAVPTGGTQAAGNNVTISGSAGYVPGAGTQAGGGVTITAGALTQVSSGTARNGSNITLNSGQKGNAGVNGSIVFQVAGSQVGTFYGTNNNFGVGVTTPSQLLTIASTGAYAFDNGAGTADTMFSRLSAGKMSVDSSTLGNSAGTLIVGNIGVGTTTPWGKLAVNLNSGDTNANAFIIASSTANRPAVSTMRTS